MTSETLEEKLRGKHKAFLTSQANMVSFPSQMGAFVVLECRNPFLIGVGNSWMKLAAAIPPRGGAKIAEFGLTCTGYTLC
jgi:hypothetical protein